MNKSENPLILLGLHKSRSLFIVVFLVFYSFFQAGEAIAQNLMVMPRRVVFEGSGRSKDIILANTGGDSARYEISFVNFRMREDGSFEKIDTPDPGQFFADPFLRYYPRTVTLAPGESQTVKLQLTRTDKLKPGEYRSHLYFRSIPEVKPLGEKQPEKDTIKGVIAKLTPVYGITIPVIIRTGNVSTTVTLTNISLEMTSDTLPRLKMNINREGNISVFGDITVNYIPPSGKAIQVSTARGVGVYTPNPVREFQCTLENKKGVNYHAGKLEILYTEPVDKISSFPA